MSFAGKAARIGAAAFAVGLSLAGPLPVGIAAADEGASGSAPADPPSTTSDTGQTTKATAGRAGVPSGRVPRTHIPVPAGATAVAEHNEVPSSASSRFQAPATVRGERPSPIRRANTVRDSAADRAAAVRSAPRATNEAAVQAINPLPETTTGDSPQTAAPPIAPPTQVAVASRVRALATVGLPTGTAAANGDIISTLFGPFGSFFEGIVLLIRRTFFNQPPTVSPVQTTGQREGEIAGSLNAVDPEGDPMTFDVIEGPQHGKVDVDPYGNFIYTPGTDFAGRDSFNVTVTDVGFHINLFDPLRPPGTDAYLQVAQSAVQPMLTFAFKYASGSQYWTPEAREALETAAIRLASYVVVTSPTAITYTVTAEKSPASQTLASAGSDLSGAGSGFFATVVQQKILSGVDANGSAADGDIDWNFGNPWSYGATVSNSQYDFTSTAMHELMHSFGFLSYTDSAGNNSGRSWTKFDQFIVTSTGSPVISDTYRFNSGYNANLTGGNGGLFFGGPNAVAAYGGYVPLYTPDPWESGSSTSHLDDYTFTGSNTLLMNAVTETGPGIRVLSPVEVGILKDLGYTVIEPPLYAVVVIGFGFLRRCKRKR